MMQFSDRLVHPWTRRAFALSLAVAAASPLAAQTTAQPTTQSTSPFNTSSPTTLPSSRNSNGVHGVTSQPGGKFLINFVNADINTVLDELSSTAGFIIVKQVKPEGRVTIQSKQPINKDDAVALLNTILKENKPAYAAIQQDRILKIVLRDDARHMAIPVRVGADPDKIADTDELITQVIPVKSVEAVQLKQDLASIVGDVDFTANASSNALVITDTSANVKRLVKIVSALDTSLAGSTDVRVIHLEYASASGAAKLVNDLFGEQARTGRGQQDNQSRFGFFGGGGFPGSFGSDRNRGGSNNNQQNAREQARVNASSDDRTNTVVVTGPPDTLEIIAKVVKELDSNPASDETVFVFRLKNADSLNVESVVNNLFGNSTGGRSSSTSSRQSLNNNRNSVSSGNRTGGGGFGSSSSSGRSTGLGSGGLSSSGGFGSSSGGSSRFGSTGFGGFGFGGLSSSAQQSAADLSGQVTIIADPDTNSMLVRTSPKNYDRVKEILAELDRPVAQVLIKVLIAEVTHDNSTDLGAEFSILNLRASGNGQQGGTNFAIPKPPLAQGAIVQILETDFTATLRALETQGKLDVLSRPYILASDNQLASITVGQEVPRVTRSQISDTGQTNNTIEYDDIGILLDVIPHINPDGLVILDVAPEISALTSSSIQVSEQVSAPIFNKRSAQSRVGVANGQTIVIGGLMEDRKTTNVNKVPFLGDIPLIGNLFRHKIDSKTKTELLIFLTPHVAAEPEMLKKMSQDEMNGTKLVPNSVEPGAFQDHLRGMQRGATTHPTTQDELK